MFKTLPSNITEWIILALRIGFGVILIYASLDKLVHPLNFAQATENYQIVGARLSRWVAVWLPYLELVIGLLFVLKIWPDAAVLLNFIMMAVFFIAVLQAYARGLDITCGCFSTNGSSQIDMSKLGYNFILLTASFALLFLLFKKQSK